MQRENASTGVEWNISRNIYTEAHSPTPQRSARLLFLYLICKTQMDMKEHNHNVTLTNRLTRTPLG